MNRKMNNKGEVTVFEIFIIILILGILASIFFSTTRKPAEIPENKTPENQLSEVATTRTWYSLPDDFSELVNITRGDYYGNGFGGYNYKWRFVTYLNNSGNYAIATYNPDRKIVEIEFWVKPGNPKNR